MWRKWTELSDREKWKRVCLAILYICLAYGVLHRYH